MNLLNNIRVAVVGLGYVGLPLALKFGRKFQTFGYDSSASKIDNFHNFNDATGEVSSSDFEGAEFLEFHNDPSVIKDADIVVIAVPTPVDSAHSPDVSDLVSASDTVGEHMKRGAVVIYESTVYPGLTEETCVPVLEGSSGMRWMIDFHVGYSPERVNPGDKTRTLSNIVKVVSGDCPQTTQLIKELYESIVEAGVHVASSIKVAEAAKVIENTQRDLNIALVNEFAIIFNKLSIDTEEVLKAAGTKWNFLPFRPGLVGGHCIGVDPYYLTYKAEMLNYHPQVILAGRRINDGMPAYIAQEIIKQMTQSGKQIRDTRVIMLGVTFKENCPDIRNSKIIDLVKELKEYGCVVNIHDPIARPAEVQHEYGLELTKWEDLPMAEVIVAGVSHDDYLDTPLSVLLEKLNSDGIFVDIKSDYSKKLITDMGFRVWRL
jgi:UDP-N-acetyl-D-glucosamine/UDP-N-acetyl-D-galactosamine dehydrogenase